MKRALFVLLLFGAASSLHAQQRNVSLQMQDTTGRDARPALRPLRIAKWTTLLASAGAAAYGFSQNRVADDEYAELEQLCEGNPGLCQKAADGSAYADAGMERRYQEIVDRDRNARVALLGGQIGILASVALFILDLPKNTTPDDIPYEPRRFRVGLGRDGGAVLQLRVGVAGR